jgi:hypothetical protein
MVQNDKVLTPRHYSNGDTTDTPVNNVVDPDVSPDSSDSPVVESQFKKVVSNRFLLGFIAGGVSAFLGYSVYSLYSSYQNKQVECVF